MHPDGAARGALLHRAGADAKTGKRYEWEVGHESGIPLMATIQDFDWADEVLQRPIGRQWYVPNFEHLNKALAYGDEAGAAS